MTCVVGHFVYNGHDLGVVRFVSNDHDLGVVRFVSYGYDLWCMSLCISS